jgi:hypothetical protein
LSSHYGTPGHAVRTPGHTRRWGALDDNFFATSVGGWLGQGHHGAQPCRRRRAPMDEPLVIGIFRSIQAMPIAEVLSTNVLHRYRIFAIVEQALRLPSGRTVVRQVVQHPGASELVSPDHLSASRQSRVESTLRPLSGPRRTIDSVTMVPRKRGDGRGSRPRQDAREHV